MSLCEKERDKDRQKETKRLRVIKTKGQTDREAERHRMTRRDSKKYKEMVLPRFG